MPQQRSESQNASLDPPPVYEERPLPAGWVKELDPKSGRNFYVDTLAEPPRSIWTHPLDDEQFIRGAAHSALTDDEGTDDESHDVHSSSHTTNIASSSTSAARRPSPQPADVKSHDLDTPPAAVDKKEHGASYSASTSRGAGGGSTGAKGSEAANATDSVAPKKKRNLFGRLKDKAIGTKEEREAARQRREARYREEERLYYERRNAMLAQRQRELEDFYSRGGARGAYGAGSGSYYGVSPGYPGSQTAYGRQAYAPPAANAWGGPQYQYQSSYGMNDPYGRRSVGGGGAGLGMGLLGGALAGLLVGDLLF